VTCKQAWKRLVVIAVVGVWFVAAGASSVAALPEEDEAMAFIEGLANQAIEALTLPNATQAEKEARFRVLLREHFAVKDIGEWVLGRNWARATEAERRDYLALFEDWVVVTYVRRFERYSGESLRVSRALVGDDSTDVIVDSQIVRPNLEPVHVGWRVRDYDDSLRIVDVIVEGVSMSQTQRSDFGSIIRRGGGQVAALITEMKRTLANAN